MKEIVENDYNLNISRYVSTAEAEKEVDLKAVHIDLVSIEKELVDAKARHNALARTRSLISVDIGSFIANASNRVSLSWAST